MLGRLAVLAAPALPWVEVVLGALLCAQIARVPLAIAGAVLLCAFTVLLCSLLARGQHPPCACFGSWSAKPVGWRHVVRNAALVGLAAVAILT